MKLPSIKETSRLFGDARYRSVEIAAGQAVGPVASRFLRGYGYSCVKGVLKSKVHLLRPRNYLRLCIAAPPKAKSRTEINTPSPRMGEKL